MTEDPDEIRWPRNGELGYYIAYPLMICVLGTLALGFVTSGMILGLLERFVWRTLTP